MTATPMRTLLDQLSSVKGAKFASFTYRSKETGELARYTVILGVDYGALYQKDRDTLEGMLPSLSGLEREAGQALLQSITESLEKGLGNNHRYTHGPEQGDTYVSLTGVPGAKVNKNDGALHLVCIMQSKTVLEPGTYKEVKSKPLTLAKKKLEKNLRRSAIRQFVLSGLTSARLNGETLELAV